MVTYEFYMSSYHGGSIPANEWPAYEAKAAAQLRQYKRIYTVTTPEDYPEGENMAVCAMAEVFYTVDLFANGEAGVQSASIGSVSTSYGSAGAAAVDVTPNGTKRALYDAVKTHLEIYRGVG